MTQDVEAGAAGTLKHLVAEGWTMEPGAVVGCLLDAGESAVPQELLDRVAGQAMRPPEGATDGAAEAAASAPPPPPEPASERSAAASAPAAARAPGERAIASPAARKLAAQHGLDLDAIAPTGPRGRIQERDVRAAIDAGAPAAAVPAVGPGAAASAAIPPIPYRGRRRTIGQRMHESLRSMAQLSGEVDVEAAAQQLHGLNREWRSERVVVTFTMLVVKAAVLALREHPLLNARLEADQIVVAPEVNVGLAVDHEDGLMVPVLRGADRMALQELARQVAILTDRVKDGTLGVDDVSGGTFTVSSLKGFNIDTFTPVINPPQAAILGVGRVRDVTRFDGSTARRGQASTLSLAFDHRVMDGAPAARFLDRVMELLNRPYVLM